MRFPEARLIFNSHQLGEDTEFWKKEGRRKKFFYKFMRSPCDVLVKEFLCCRRYRLSLDIANKNLFFANVTFKCSPDPCDKFLFD